MGGVQIPIIRFSDVKATCTLNNFQLKQTGDELHLLPKMVLGKYLIAIITFPVAAILLSHFMKSDSTITKTIVPLAFLAAAIILLPLIWFVDIREIRKGAFLKIDTAKSLIQLPRQNITLKFEQITAMQQIEGDKGGDGLCQLDFLIKSDRTDDTTRCPILWCSNHGAIIKISKNIADILNVRLDIITNDWRGRPFATLKAYSNGQMQQNMEMK